MAAGKSLWPTEVDSFVQALSQTKKAKLPSVVVVDRLEALHEILAPFVDPHRRNADRELRTAVEAGALNDAPVRERYGDACWSETDFVLLPALDGRESDPRNFRLQGDTLHPPRQR